MEYKSEKAEYQADAATCNACPLKGECTPSPNGRQVHHSFHADYLERVKSYYQTEPYQKALRKRKVWVERYCQLICKGNSSGGVGKAATIGR
jgi:Transposase DDE domain